jgi:ribulose 1,5-bisphosphate synthetase/thiazole synthase
MVLLLSSSLVHYGHPKTHQFGSLFVQAMAMSSKEAAGSSYDLVVIGGGSAGLTAAKLAGKTLQKSVVIVESNKLGGDCTWTG